MTASDRVQALFRQRLAPVVFLPVALVFALAMSLGLAGCSTGSGPSGSDDGDDDDDPGCVVFVDDDYVGDGLGTQDQPFNTIEEGIAAADSGCTVRLAPGTYGTRGIVEVPRLMSLVGAGQAESRVNATFELAMFTPPAPVRVCSLDFENLVFGIRPDSASYAFAPVIIRDCHVDAVVESSRSIPPLCPFRLIDCDVDGDVLLKNVECLSARTLSGCDVGGDVTLWQVAGDTSAVVNSVVGGDLSLWTIAAERQTASYNTIDGSAKLWAVAIEEQYIQGSTVSGESLYAKSVSSHRTWITGNTVPNAMVWLQSRSASDVSIEDNALTGGGIRVLSKAVAGVVDGNTVTPSRSGESGIRLTSRAASLEIRDNTVTLPYTPPTGTPAEVDTLAPSGIIAISTSGPWVRDNQVTGGTYGIYCKSYAAEVSGNDVTGSHTGIYARAMSCSLGWNTVTDCVGDGIHLDESPDTLGGLAVYRISGSTIADNGGAGVRANGYTLLESGAGRAGNTITGNGDYDLLVETMASVVETLPAGGNYWDHATVEDVNEYDVWDGKDDPSLTTVILSPLGGGGGAW